MKKFRRSPLVYICYALACLMLVYVIFIIFSTINQINQYYAAYNMSAGFGEVLGYLVQNGMTPLTSAILVCMAGKILDEAMKANPANWMSDEELIEAKEAKQLAKLEKQTAKYEKSGEESEDEVPEIKETEGEDIERVFSAETVEDSNPEDIADKADYEEVVAVAEDTASEGASEEAASVESAAEEAAGEIISEDTTSGEEGTVDFTK